MHLRTLTDQQRKIKEQLLKSAKKAFFDDPILLDDYTNLDWRLARIDSDLKHFLSGETVIARKEEVPSGAVPRIFVFCPKTQSHMCLRTTDPIEFLED